MYLYNRAWKHLLSLMVDHGIESFDCGAVEKLMEIIDYKREGKKGLNGKNWHKATDKYYYIRSLKMLIMFQESNEIKPRFDKKEDSFELPEPMNSQLKDFYNHLTLKLRRNNITINAYKFSLKAFTEYLKSIGNKSLEELDIVTIINYIRKITPQTRITPFLQIGHIRGLVKYLYESGILKSDLSSQIPRARRIVQPKLPSVYSREEIEKVLNSNLRITEIDKRDYAMILLMARLGLRVSDVVNLSFDNLKWRENKIQLIQSKTGQPLVLPLLPDVGNAIIDYLKYGRPAINSDKVFIRNRYPYEMTSTSILIIVKNAFMKAGINTTGKHCGPHALRHSLSARLLEENTILPVITEVLGHERAETTKYYMRIDVKSMEKCLIDFPQVKENHFQQILSEYGKFVQ